MPPVGAVGAAAVFGLGGFDEAAGLAGQAVEAGDCPALEFGDDQIVGHNALNCSGFLAPDKRHERTLLARAAVGIPAGAWPLVRFDPRGVHTESSDDHSRRVQRNQQCSGASGLPATFSEQRPS